MLNEDNLYMFNYQANSIHNLGHKLGSYSFSKVPIVKSTANNLYIYGPNSLFNNLYIIQIRTFYSPEGYDMYYYTKDTGKDYDS
jgi:hypothetical protein